MSSTRSKFIVITNDDRNVFALRANVSQYSALIACINSYFPSVRNKMTVIQTRDLAICAGRFVDIPPNLWPHIKDDIDNIRVQVIETRATRYWNRIAGFANKVDALVQGQDMNRSKAHVVAEDLAGKGCLEK
ncbi:hypothetical protein ARMGADRAFT_1171364 [Armillaria gallica]|uniref:Uncharacterized protein n=1 Tax=Armillaria gallica TaxID=47427 RepID=A0A2H3CXS1_ARMGA|nr:hypothetical protein ARMGADRAFT_1171364 [Armillaria gallica]